MEGDLRLRVGDVVSYKCIAMSSTGVPQQSVIYRKRDDLTWDDVLIAEKNEQTLKKEKMRTQHMLSYLGKSKNVGGPSLKAF